MYKKMGEKIYVAPRLEVLLYNVENDLVANTIPIVDGPGEDLGKENFIVFSDLPDDEYTWGDLWAENENEEE
jgi:hypothetical protein